MRAALDKKEPTITFQRSFEFLPDPSKILDASVSFSRYLCVMVRMFALRHPTMVNAVLQGGNTV